MSGAFDGALPEALFSRDSDEWETPAGLVAWLDMSFQFTLDPAATAENSKCERYYTIADDGLGKSWRHERVFLNPPYSAVGQWMQKAYEAAQHEEATVVCLVAVRSDTRWWQNWVMGKANEIQYLAGRVTFKRPGKEANTAPFPSALVIYRPPIRREHTRPPARRAGG